MHSDEYYKAKYGENDLTHKSKERVKEHGEVFTPAWLVAKMCDMLDEESDGRAFELGKTFIEPCCGTGNFAVEIVGRLLEKCKTPEDVRTAVSSYYSIEIQQDNVEECRARVAKLVAGAWPDVDVSDILERNIVQGDFLRPGGIWFMEEYVEQFELDWQKWHKTKGRKA